MITQPNPGTSIAAARRVVASIPRQVRYAASVAINSALADAQRAERERVAQVFDRPTPYVVRGAALVQRADKASLTGSIALATDTTAQGNLPPGKPLLANVKGGARRYKRSELLLQRAGVLPSGYLTVPGRAARLDAYGNMARGQILEILAWFQTFGVRQQGDTRRNSWRDNLTDKGRERKRLGTRNRAGVEYFAVRPGERGRLSPGIYKRQVSGRFVGPVGQRPQAVLIFVQRAVYARRLDFIEQAEAAIAAGFGGHFDGALRRALSTAR